MNHQHRHLGIDLAFAEEGGRGLVRGTGADKDDNLQQEVVFPAVGHQPGLHPVDHLKLFENPCKVQVGQG